MVNIAQIRAAYLRQFGSDLAKAGIDALYKKMDDNNASIAKLDNQLKDLKASKVTPEDEAEENKIMSDASAGEPKIGNAGGRLMRHAMIYRENREIDKKAGQIQQNINGLQNLNGYYQKNIDGLCSYVIDE